MNNQRIYTIQINGINESTTSVDTLLAKLNELQAKVNQLSKEGVKLKIGGGNKDDGIEQSANSVAALRKELAKLKKEWANTDISSDGFTELTQKVLEANNKVKEMEKSIGVFSRDVGNYTNSLVAAFGKFPPSVQQSLNGLKAFNGETTTLQQQVKACEKGLNELTASGKENSEEFKALLSVYAELKDKSDQLKGSMSNAADNLAGFNSIIGIMGEMTNAFTLATASSQLFGQSNEEVAEGIAKLQQLAVITNSLKEIQKSFQAGGTAIKIWQYALSSAQKITRLFRIEQATATATQRTATVATTAQAASMGTLTTATAGATAAVTAFDIALAATGIGAIVVAIGALVGWMVTLGNETEKTKKKFEAFSNDLSSKWSALKRNLESDVKLGKITNMDANSQMISGLSSNIEELIGHLTKYKKTANSTASETKLLDYLRSIGLQYGNISQTSQAILTLENYMNQFSGNEKFETFRKEVEKLHDALVELYGLQSNSIDLGKEAVQRNIQIQNQIAKNRLDIEKDSLQKRLALLDQAEKEELQSARQNKTLTEALKTSIVEKYAAKRLQIEKDTENEIADIINNTAINTMKSRTEEVNSKIQKAYLAIDSAFQETVDRMVLEKEKYPALYDSDVIKLIFGDYEAEFPQTIEDMKMYMNNIRAITYKAASTINEELKDTKEKRLQTLLTELENEKNIQEQSIRDSILSEEDKEFALNNIKKDYQNKRKTLERNFATEEIQLQLNAYKKIIEINKTTISQLQKLMSTGYNNIVTDLKTKLDSNVNSFGIINLKKTKEDLNTAREQIKVFSDYVKGYETSVISLFAKGEIDYSTFQDSINQVKEWRKNIKEQLKSFDKDWVESVSNFVSSINTYFQAVGQGVQQVMSAAFDKINADMDYEMDKLEDENDRLSDLLDKQVDIVEKHNDKIDEIEGELGSARGDRRDQLIDALNAEKLAREAAYAEEKRIEREKERNERKQRELEKKQKREQHKQQVAQAIISAALATANGFATQPFMPVGLAMGALAAALGAAQVAIISSTKYANGGQLDGGVAQGASHANGGIKVLGGRAEIEGGEFVTNRQSTMQNLPLLEYINSQKHKINVQDLVEFYNGNKSTHSTNKLKFANGGQLPTMNGVNLNNNRSQIIVQAPEQKLFISVEEFERVQNNMHQVQTLAGYE